MILANPKSQSLTWKKEIKLQGTVSFLEQRSSEKKGTVLIPEDNPDQRKEEHSPVSSHNERRSCYEGISTQPGSSGSKELWY